MTIDGLKLDKKKKTIIGLCPDRNSNYASTLFFYIQPNITTAGGR